LITDFCSPTPSLSRGCFEMPTDFDDRKRDAGEVNTGGGSEQVLANC
jgi:hypothetical protein